MGLEVILIAILFIHQTLDITGVKGYVDRPALVSPDTIGWGIFLVALILYLLGVPGLRLTLVILFGLVLVGLWFFHWKLYLFGATEGKIAGYNKTFANTHRILPMSETRLVPDTYHMVHTLLYGVNFVVLVVNLFRLGL